MIENQPAHKQMITVHSSPTGTFSFLAGFSLLLFLIPSLVYADNSPFAQLPSQSDIQITSPGFNSMTNNTSLNIGGTFHSPNTSPTITVYVDGSSYGASISVSSSANQTIGTWVASVTAGNGWHQVKATISDLNGALSTSSEFLVNDGTTNQGQIKYKQINIEYTPACVALLQSGDTTSCPPLEKLIPVDNSSQKVSGQFIMTKNGMIRGPPQLTNAYMFYNKTTICVDCLIDATSQATMRSIWIEPIGFSYTQHNFTQTVQNTPFILNGIEYNQTSYVNEDSAGLVVYHNKWVDGGCLTAEVVYLDDTTIPDTIKYLTGGCVEKNFFDTSQTVIVDHPFSLDNPYSSLHYDSLLKTLLHGHHVFSANGTSGGLGPGNCITSKCENLSIGNNFNTGIWNTKSK